MSKRTYRSTPEPHYANKLANLEEIIKDALDVCVVDASSLTTSDFGANEDNKTVEIDCASLINILDDGEWTELIDGSLIIVEYIDGGDRKRFVIGVIEDDPGYIDFANYYDAGVSKALNIYFIKGLKNIAKLVK